MSLWSPSSEVAWNALATMEVRANEVRTGPLAVMRAGEPLYISVSEKNERSLLLPLLSTDNTPALLRTKSLSVAQRTLIGPRGAILYIEMKCLDSRDNARFGVICDEIVHAVAADPAAPPAQIIAEALTRWRQLVAANARRLTESEVVGLWGELSLLLDLTRIDASAVTWWCGPKRAHHDFRRDQRAVEVKSTVGGGSNCTISGIEQLESPAGGSLHLCHCQLAKATNGQTVRDLFLEVAALWSADEVTTDALADAGVSADALESYEHLRCQRTSISLFEVRDGFPRIVTDSFVDGRVPSGTSAIKYQLDLSTAIQWRIPAGEIGSVLRSFLNV